MFRLLLYHENRTEGDKMSTKDEILAILERNQSQHLSGQKIADELGVSRTAVWKAINTLKEAGYQISSVSNAGYKLMEATDSLNAAAIKPLLKYPIKVETFQTIDSTNAEAKRQLNDNPDQLLLVLAEAQEKGRGRLGRTFYSPSRNGIYMSMTLPHLKPATDATLVTTAAAVAVCRAIEDLTNLTPQIKWVNDIYLDDKKICGILTEGIISMETQTIQSIILGIGINVTMDPELPTELKDIVGALFETESPVSRNELAASIINHFFIIYETMDTRDYLEEYRKRCFVLGKRISFNRNKETLFGTATGIDNTGALEIQCEDGTETKISYGEISIKWRNNE